MKQFAAIVLVSLLFAAVAVSAHAVTIERASVTTSDGVRRYFIARPSRAKSGPRPLVILLHGHGGSAAQSSALSRQLPSGARSTASWKGLPPKS
jgi:polyhydroxybutyrate depolymerase